MIKNFLEIHSKEDVSNAISLFLNRDITTCQFGSFNWDVITGKQLSDKFDDVEITIECYIIQKDSNKRISVCSAHMPYKSYSLIIRDVVDEEIKRYRELSF